MVGDKNEYFLIQPFGRLADPGANANPSVPINDIDQDKECRNIGVGKNGEECFQPDPVQDIQ